MSPHRPFLLRPLYGSLELYSTQISSSTVQKHAENSPFACLVPTAPQSGLRRSPLLCDRGESVGAISSYVSVTLNCLWECVKLASGVGVMGVLG